MNRIITIALPLAGLLVAAGCSAPARDVPLPVDHPANPAADEAAYRPPATPLTSGRPPRPAKTDDEPSGGHNHQHHGGRH